MSAAERMRASVMRSVQVYQSFQPIGGVRASVSPTTIASGRCATPWAFVAESVTAHVPALAGLLPVMMPVEASRVRPSGSPVASKRIGRVPVHGTRYRNGWPGRHP